MILAVAEGIWPPRSRREPFPPSIEADPVHLDVAHVVSRSTVSRIVCRWLAILGLATPAMASPPSFDHEVMAVLSRAGCNMGACHGNLNGKGGLRLSLRGQDAWQDYLALTHDQGGRRIERNRPEESLVYLKPTTGVPHQGGQRIQPGSLESRILLDWIAAGTPGPDATAPRLERLEVIPAQAVVYPQDPAVQLRVTATFSDGQRRDVTPLAAYEVSNYVASVAPSGRVEPRDLGETTIAVRYLDQQVCVRLAYIHDDDTYRWSAPMAHNRIDALIDSKLRQLQLRPRPVASDHVFLRRIYLDLLGRLPTADEAQSFEMDDRPDKRIRRIDQLLARDEFNDHWALKWSDLLRNEEKLLDQRGVQVFHAWIRDNIARDVPLGEFVRQLIVGRGSTYDHPPANYYRALRDPLARGETTAQLFLGIRLQCAKCHNHPFDVWTQDDYYDWASLFARIDYEIVENKRRDKFDKQEFVGEQKVVMQAEGEVKNPRDNSTAFPRVLGDSATQIDADGDRLEQLAHWLTTDTNRDFARAQANRVWYHLMGRGLVNPIDDFRVTNPASHPLLLDWLADELTNNDYSLRHLIRVIAQSRTYQSKWLEDDTNVLAAENYAGTIPRRLTAEQLLDAQCQVLDVPAQFHGYEHGIRANQMAGTRAVRLREQRPTEDERFLTLFGKPARLLSCECERSDETTLTQAFYLIGGPGLQMRLGHPNNRLHDWLASGISDEAIVEALFRTTLTRNPTPEERSAAVAHLRQAESRRIGLEDLTWATLNAKEFLFRR